MRAIVVRSIGSFSMEDVPVPRPGPDAVLVRMTLTGLCRTDLKIIEHGHRDLTLPRIPGEELVGVVEQAGGPDDGGWCGKRVYVYPGTSCGVCNACRKGAGNLCRGMQIMGFHRDGGFAAFVSVSKASLIELPDFMPDETAVFAEPLSCCLNALELGCVQAGDRVCVWGGGPAGTLLARAALARGAQAVSIVDPDAQRSRFHGSLAVAAPEGEYDVAIPAVGNVQAYEQALQNLAPRGRLVIFSGLLSEQAKQSIDLNMLHYHEQTLVGAYGCSFRHGGQAVEWLASGRVRVDDLVTHRFPLEALGDALDVVRSRSGMKVLLY